LQPISKIGVQVSSTFALRVSRTSSEWATQTEVPRMTRSRPNAPQYRPPAQRHESNAVTAHELRDKTYTAA
jgi:hypothetical protein